MPLTLDTILSPADHVLACDLADESALLDTERGIYFGLNAVGTRIWHAIRQPASLRSVLDALLDEYDVAPAECERDILQVAGQLLEHGLVRTQPAPVHTSAA